jgi:hypothetical protein
VAAIDQPDSDPYDSFDPMAQFIDGVAGNVRDPYPRLRKKRPDVPVERAFQMNFAEEEVEAWTAHVCAKVAPIGRARAQTLWVCGRVRW